MGMKMMMQSFCAQLQVDKWMPTHIECIPLERVLPYTTLPWEDMLDYSTAWLFMIQDFKCQDSYVEDSEAEVSSE